MKFFYNRKSTVTILLIALLLISCFLIIRLELRAASLQSRLDEHHSELKNNSDELVQLKKIHRKVGDNFIHISKALLQLGTGPNTNLVFNEEIFSLIIRTGDLRFEIAEYKHYKIIELINENSKIILKDGNIEIKVADDKSFGYDKKSDLLYMKNKGVSMHMGKLNDDKGKFLDYGTFFRTNSGVQFTIRDEGISGWVPSNNGSYSFKLAAKKKYVELKKDNSILRMEGDDISIEAPGDINITSKNGKVNINGKR